MNRIGFILLTHSNPSQVFRLIQRLDTMFERPPIICHHDFLKCQLDENLFGENVSFVKPWVVSQWGDFSLVEAVIKAVRLMERLPNPPEWTVLLSGADYPIKSADKIITDLKKGGADAYLSAELIELGKEPARFQTEMASRYLRFEIPFTRRQIPLARIPIALPFKTMRRFTQWRDGFDCYSGSQWFAANQKSLNYLLEFYDSHSRFNLFMRGVPVADEAYFQTVLCNARQLHVRRDQNYRFIEFEGAHARILKSADLDKLFHSDKHFARKFDPAVDMQVLVQLDRLIV